MTDVIGWAASLLLLCTLVNQVLRQWRTGAVSGVSPYLFIGQTGAALGFTIYSVLKGDAVFIVTNALLLINALAGLAIDRRNRARARPAQATPPGHGGRGSDPNRVTSVSGDRASRTP